MAIHHCPHCNYKSTKRTNVVRHEVSKHIDSPEQYFELQNDSIQLNLDPVAPIGLNGQNLPFEPITILASRSKCFTFIGGV